MDANEEAGTAGAEIRDREIFTWVTGGFSSPIINITKKKQHEEC